MSRRNQFSVHPGLLAVLIILSGLLSISQYLTDESATDPTPPPGEVRFLQVRFEEPVGMTIDLDATEHDAIELRDAWLVTPAEMSFRMNAEFAIQFDGVSDGSHPLNSIQGILATEPPSEHLDVQFFKMTTMRVRINDADLEHLANGTAVSLVYYLPSSVSAPPPDSYLASTASTDSPGSDLLNEFEYGALVAVLRLERLRDAAGESPRPPSAPVEVHRLCPLGGIDRS